MACRVPVLVSPQVNLAGEIERANCGWVVPLDQHRVATALAEIMANDQERIKRGIAGYELAQIRFSWPVVARELAGVYSSTLNALRKQPSLVA
jgi:glycosyltransferase involved in cell wall biosynthesis